jgi:hypothetical protein
LNHSELLEPQIQRWEMQNQRKNERFSRVYGSVEYARRELRRVLSECKSLTNNLTDLNQAPPVQAALWLRLSRTLSYPEVVWDCAMTLGLISPKRCQRVDLSPSKMFVFPLPTDLTGHDENGLCSLDGLQNAIITFAVIPMLNAP